MEKDIQAVTEACDQCCRGEHVRAAKTPYITARSGWRVFDEWSIDLLSDLPVTTRGFSQLLVAVEAVTKFTEIYPLKARTSKEASQAVMDLVLRFGLPRRIRVDQGSEFEGEFSKYLLAHGVEVKVISSHHPQANGMVERMNQEVIDRLTRSLTGDGDVDWDLDCRQACFGINASVSRRLEMTPFEALFGTPPRITRYLEEVNGGWEHSEKDAELALKNHYLRRKDLDDLIREGLGKYENERAGIQLGTLVWVRNFARKKFDPKWIGPSVVVEVRKHAVKVKGESGQTRVVNKGDVKLYKLIGEVMREIESVDNQEVVPNQEVIPNQEVVPQNQDVVRHENAV